MNKNKEIELYYIVPYTKIYNSGGYYRNDETCSTSYRPPSESIWNDNPIVFDEKEQLLNWFYQHAGNPIPTVYKLRYIANYKGIDDVIEMTNLYNGYVKYYTALSKNKYALYDDDYSKHYGKTIWKPGYLPLYVNTILRFDIIYDEFRKRGIKIKYDVYKQDIDKSNFFEFIGDPFYPEDSEKMKTKQLILFKSKANLIWK